MLEVAMSISLCFRVEVVAQFEELTFPIYCSLKRANY